RNYAGPTCRHSVIFRRPDVPGRWSSCRFRSSPLRLDRGNCDRPGKRCNPKSIVAIKNTSTGLSRQVSTDENGYYSITNLPEGTYDLSVSAPGFRPLTQRGVNVLINNVARVNVGLEVGAITESVTVEASAAQLQTAKADVNVNLEQQAIENLPLAGYRNFQSLINLVPGATPGRLQNAVIDTPQRDLTFNFNGQDRGDN